MAPAPRPTTDDAPPAEIVDAPAALAAPAATVLEVELEPDPPVRARWVDVQSVLVAGVGIIRYGDEIYVSPEQLASPAHTTIPWSDDWVADPTLFAQSRKEG